MTRRRNAPPVPALDRSHIVENTSRAGAIVRILDTEGHVEPGIYVIKVDAHNTRTGSHWVELFGGARGFNNHRQVIPERVRPVTKSELRRAHLTQEEKT